MALAYDYVDLRHDEELVCSICMMPFIDPLTCPGCRQSFCETHTPTLTNCPLCRQSWREKPLLPPARMVVNILNRLLVRCPNAHCDRGRAGGLPLQRGELAAHVQQCPVLCSEGCGALVAPCALQEHNVSCPAAMVPCGAGCGHRASRAELPTHERECPLLRVACAHGCPLLVPRRDMAAHDLVCPAAEVPCPFGCSLRLARRDLPAHDTICLEKIAACPAADIGCGHREPRRSLVNHERVCAIFKDRRGLLLEKALETMQRENERIRAALQRLERQFANMFDESGFSKPGSFHRDTGTAFDPQGFDRDGRTIDGRNRDGFDRDGFNREGFDQRGYNRLGFDREGFDRFGYNREGYSRDGYDRNGFSRKGFNISYDR
eukprot:gnl/Spiro4/4104_TR2044_c0_g1_i1.p1 gnl/Spiro4/4104_TR2044_c0_g1~~gnl/Spiro4/4104_TR2044_c0_g1_i1.p1  ORF type:complete len:394 (+),score=102.31 gnl/Spiro4/4104_TR2044_c0_g1_i1:53-1183(+)